MIPKFVEKARAVSAEVTRCATRAEAWEAIVERLKAEGVRDERGAWAVMAPCAFARGLDVAFPGLWLEVTTELAAGARVGISQMDGAIAATGTLFQDATEAEQRLVSTLPELHIAVVGTATVVADLAAALRRVDPRRAAYLSLITGPSRTADIERVLTIGVHGPARLWIVLVDELEVAE